MSFNIEVEGGTSGRLPTAGKYCDRDIVVTAKGENIVYPVADEPETIGQMACLARAAQMRDIQWTLQGNLAMTGGPVYEQGRVVRGLPYSSVRKTDNFIGFNISLYTFMTAVHNPRSLLYTTTTEENTANNGANANLYYGVNCSVLNSYAHDLNYHTSTNTIPELPYIERIDPSQMKLCDMPIVSLEHGGASGHAMVVTGITRNADGSINSLELTESVGPTAIATTMTYDEFIADKIEYKGYRVYRNKRLYEVGYNGSPFAQIFPEEPTEGFVYSNLCTNRGDKVSITADESITLNVLVDSGYETIKLCKNGELYGEYSISAGDIVNGDLPLPELPTGLYAAALFDADGNALDNAYTSFEVCSVATSQNGNRHYFHGDGIPVRIVFKDSGGFTIAVFDVTDEDIARGYKDVLYSTSKTISKVCVPFKTRYGFVVARCDYNSTGTSDIVIPEEYQQISYIETDGNQYIDTGVMASSYADGIKYEMKGNVTRVTNSANNNYFFGCLAGGVRAGNVSYDGRRADSPLVVYIGASSDIQFVTDLSISKDFTVTLLASSSAVYANDNKFSVNGVEKNHNGSAFTAGAMPSANIYLFSANGVSATNGKFCGKLYSFTMDKADGTPIRNFVPCYRKSDNVVGLYDTVEGVFYTNAGTGSFTTEQNGNGSESGFSAEYQQVSYIETDGRQYIDTGVLASDYSDGIAYEFRGNATGITDTDSDYLFGASANGTRAGNVNISETQMSLLVGTTSYNIMQGSVPSWGSDFTLVVSNLTSASATIPSATVNGNALGTTGSVISTGAMPNANIWLFACNGVTGETRRFYGKLYGFVMTSADGTTIRNFVPCYRKADSVIGLYDTVNDVFYTNAGAGSFTKGADV